jgi:hypothetical protein
MIYKTIVLLSLLLITIIIIYNSTYYYVKEHIGVLSNINIATNYKNPTFVDPVIHNKQDSYDMGYIYYGSPYESGSEYVLPSGSSKINEEDLLRESINSRKLKLNMLIQEMNKEEHALSQLEKYSYPKIVSMVMKLTHNNTLSSWDVIETSQKYYKSENAFKKYLRVKLRQKLGYYNSKEFEKVDETIYTTIKNNITKRKQEIKEYIKKYDLDNPIYNIQSTSTVGNIYEDKLKEVYKE